ncbi:type II toxin-antitoxin system RelE/ParE family toxin [Blastopirellula sp. J2-11]|nr:type II toxin-antitoxin system RelE/ParE family toxin [Blastopirellula sp. J2-11]
MAQDKPQAARRWLHKIRDKCRFVSSQPDIGDPRDELGAGVRAVAFGRYVIFFRHGANEVQIVRILPGDRDPTLL